MQFWQGHFRVNQFSRFRVKIRQGSRIHQLFILYYINYVFYGTVVDDLRISLEIEAFLVTCRRDALVSSLAPSTFMGLLAQIAILESQT